MGMKELESEADAVAGGEGEPAIGGEKHETMIVVVVVAGAEGRSEAAVDVEDEPAEEQLVATFGEEGDLAGLGGALGRGGIGVAVAAVLAEGGEDELGFEVEAGEPGIAARLRGEAPLEGELEEEPMGVGMVHEIPAEADDAEGELGAVAGREGPFVGEARRAAAEGEHGDLKIVAAGAAERPGLGRKQDGMQDASEEREQQYKIVFKGHRTSGDLFCKCKDTFFSLNAEKLVPLQKFFREMNNLKYNLRGVSAQKEDVHNAIKNIDKGIYPKAFCKIIPDILGGDKDYCNIMHADGAGTKSSLAYLYWKETGDLSVWKGIAIDAVVMNLDDLLCVGAVDNILLSSTIGRNKQLIPGEVISAVINGTEEFLQEMRDLGIGIHLTGGETADVGDLVRTIIVDSTVTARMRRSDVVDNGRIKAGNVIVGLASYGQASYEKEYNGGMGSNGLTSARHDVFSQYYAGELRPQAAERGGLLRRQTADGQHRSGRSGCRKDGALPYPHIRAGDAPRAGRIPAED